MKKLKSALFVKNILLVLIFFSSIFSVYSHGEEGSEYATTHNSYDTLNPLTHFSEQNWLTGALVIVFWFALFHGFYTLLFLVVGSHIVRGKK